MFPLFTMVLFCCLWHEILSVLLLKQAVTFILLVRVTSQQLKSLTCDVRQIPFLHHSLPERRTVEVLEMFASAYVPFGKQKYSSFFFVCLIFIYSTVKNKCLPVCQHSTSLFWILSPPFHFVQLTLALTDSRQYSVCQLDHIIMTIIIRTHLGNIY